MKYGVPKMSKSSHNLHKTPPTKSGNERYTMSPTELHRSKYGEAHQGSYLIEAKERNSETKKRIGSKTPNRTLDRSRLGRKQLV